MESSRATHTKPPVHDTRGTKIDYSLWPAGARSSQLRDLVDRRKKVKARLTVYRRRLRCPDRLKSLQIGDQEMVVILRKRLGELNVGIQQLLDLQQADIDAAESSSIGS